MNQGKGIEIFSTSSGIIKFIGMQPPHTFWVVQKYLEKPLLYKKRKFDIRIWALFTAKNEVWFYDKGYLRTSSADFSLSDANNYTHLTNNCLQQHGDDYGKHEDGNTIGFEDFQVYLGMLYIDKSRIFLTFCPPIDETFPDLGIKIEEHFLPRMKDIVIDTFMCIRKQINNDKRENSFEFLGYDFMIDEDFRIWLIEVNSNPYIGIPNDYIRNMLPWMIDDMLKITLDPVFPGIRELDDSKNYFDLIFSPGGTENSETPLNKRRSFDLSNIYPIPEFQDDILTKRIQFVKDYQQKRIDRITTMQKLSTSIDQDNIEETRTRDMLK